MSEHLHRPHTSESVARDVARAMLAPAHDAARHAVVPADAAVDVPSEILAALRRRRIRVFEIGSAAVVSVGLHRPTVVEGRVRLRIDDGRWSLATVEAAIVALLLTVDPELPNGALFADAFRLAAVQAEGKVAAVHALAEGRAA